MLSYYVGVKDTASFFKEATVYYDNFFMNLSADEIKTAETIQSKTTLTRSRPTIISSGKQLTPAQLDSLSKIPGNVTRRETVSMITAVNQSTTYSNALNEGAWKFYQSETTNINHLSKAMIWSRRAIELNDNSAYYDTLAHILYRMKYFAEAEKTQEIAIKKAKAEGKPDEMLREELKKIKNKSI